MLTNGELISLVGIIIVFLTTIIGWIFTARTQRQILNKQNKAAADLLGLQMRLEQRNEQNIHLANDRIYRLNEIERWIETCRSVFLDSSMLIGLQMDDFNA